MGNSPLALEVSHKAWLCGEAWVSTQHCMRSVGTWQRESPWQCPRWSTAHRARSQRAGEGAQAGVTWGQGGGGTDESQGRRGLEPQTCRGPRGALGEPVLARGGAGCGVVETESPGPDEAHTPAGRPEPALLPTSALDSAVRLARHCPVSVTPCGFCPRIYLFIRWISESLHAVLSRVSKIKMQINPLTRPRGHRRTQSLPPPPPYMKALNLKFHFPIAFQ